MKIIYEENEIERLEESRNALIDMGHGTLFDDTDPDRVYSINFTVTKFGLAEYILLSLLNNRLEDFDSGIDVKSINFTPIKNVNEVKQKLHELIDQADI